MKIAIIIVLFLNLPVVYALNCSNVPEEDMAVCNEIIQSNISDLEKQLLVGNIMYSNAYYANHSFILNWNTGINFTTAPYGIKTIDKGYIRDAWLRIIAIMPSVWLKDDLLNPGYGKVLSAYNYWVEIPSGIEPGDCKTEFSLSSDNKQLTIYLNNELIGDSVLSDFNGTGNLSFNALLWIQATIEVKHYRNYQYCCRRDENGCHKYCTVCQYENTEYRTDELNLQDSKQAYHHKPLISPKIKTVNRYHNTTLGILNISNFDAFTLDFENSSFSQFNYYYDVTVSFPPYDVLTFRANKYTKKELNNLNIEQLNSSYKFYIANSNRCKITYYDHFHKWEENCSLNDSLPLFEIRTDKLQYNENETIHITLEPKNTPIKIKYGNEEILGRNSVQLRAKSSINKITAYLEEREVQQIIHVKRKDTWNFVINFGVFSGVLYSLYLVIRKYVFWM